MEGTRKESPANSAAGGCTASLLLQPAIKIYSVKLLSALFQTCVSQVWLKITFSETFTSSCLSWPERGCGSWRLQLKLCFLYSAAQQLEDYSWLYLLQFLSLLFCCLYRFRLPSSISHLLIQTLPQVPQKGSLCLKRNHSLQPWLLSE